MDGLVNGHTRRIFQLECLLDENGEFLEKDLLMEKLGEYDNLINAMGALFYTSKKMVS